MRCVKFEGLLVKRVNMKWIVFNQCSRHNFWVLNQRFSSCRANREVCF